MAAKKPLIVNNGLKQVIQTGDVVDSSALGTGATTSTAILRGDNAWTETYTISGTPPSSPRVGDVWLNTTDGIEYTRIDAGALAWVDLGKSSAFTLQHGVPMFVGPTEPTSNAQYMWIQTEMGDGEDYSLWINI